MKKTISFLTVCFVLPLLVLLGILFGSKSYGIISLFIALFSCVPFFIKFECNTTDTKRLMIIAAMIGLSVAGRMLFAAVPNFKPITAMVIIGGIYLGSEAGFMVGSLAAVISNFYFGQGAWTPFQMLIWGIIGFLAGIIANKLKNNLILVVVYGFFTGIVYSLFMDLWSVIWMNGGFNLAKYFALVATSLPIMVVYAVSNIIFLAILTKPFGRIFERLKTKYGI